MWVFSTGHDDMKRKASKTFAAERREGQLRLATDHKSLRGFGYLGSISCVS